jgi:hypothetical protein
MILVGGALYQFTNYNKFCQVYALKCNNPSLTVFTGELVIAPKAELNNMGPG